MPTEWNSKYDTSIEYDTGVWTKPKQTAAYCIIAVHGIALCFVTSSTSSTAFTHMRRHRSNGRIHFCIGFFECNIHIFYWIRFVFILSLTLYNVLHRETSLLLQYYGFSIQLIKNDIIALNLRICISFSAIDSTNISILNFY